MPGQIARNKRRRHDRQPTTANVRDSTRRNARLAKTFDMVEKMEVPTPEELREYIADGWCWWCERGPWKNLAGHTNRGHDIDRHKLKDMALMLDSQPACDPLLSAQMRIKMLARGWVPTPPPPGYHKHLNTAAKRLNWQRLQAFTSDEQRRNANKAAVKVTIRPHPCPVCGKVVSHATPITCSPECRKVVRQRTMQQSTTKIDYVVRRLAHPCPECGKIIPTSKPKFCSVLCENAMRHHRARVHPCSICGTETGDHAKRTCSPACLAIARQRNGINGRANLTRDTTKSSSLR